jgi:hypothetical protein
MINGEKYIPKLTNAPVAEPIASAKAKDAGISAKSLPLAGSLSDTEKKSATPQEPTKGKKAKPAKKQQPAKKPKTKKQKEIRMNGVLIEPKEAK